MIAYQLHLRCDGCGAEVKGPKQAKADADDVRTKAAGAGWWHNRYRRAEKRDLCPTCAAREDAARMRRVLADVRSKYAAVVGYPMPAEVLELIDRSLEAGR